MAKLEEVVVNSILLSIEVFFFRTEVFESADAGDTVKVAQSFRRCFSPVEPVDPQVLVEAGFGLTCGECQANTLTIQGANGLQEPSPAASNVQYPLSRCETNVF